MGGRTIAWVFCVACGSSPPPPSPPSPPVPVAPVPPEPPRDAAAAKIGVALTVTPDDAEVSIDGVSRGKAAGLDPIIDLKPGLYTLLVARPGYAAYRVEFTVSDKTESFVIRLEPLKK